MEKTVVVIENEYSLKDADYVNTFLSKYDGKVVELTSFRQRDQSEIVSAISKCTDIVVQTCFVGGSDYQLDGMIRILSAMPHSINVHIAYLGVSHDNELYEYLVENVKPKELLSIAQHKVFDIGNHMYDEPKGYKLLDFTPITKKLVKELEKIQNYKDTARERPTGRKIKILGCTAIGGAFDNLPIGEIVDELICDKLVNKKHKHRGVWVWGNGEPITLVNDIGFTEYKIVTQLSPDEVIDELSKMLDTSIKIDKLSPLEIEGLLHVIKDDEESPMGKANLICELLNIEKRGNRQNIYKMLSQDLELSN